MAKKRIITAIFLAIILPIVGFTLFIKKVINDADLDSHFLTTPNFEKNEKVKFEEGGLLKKNEFDFYRSFSNDIKFTEVIYQNLEKIGNNELEVKKNFSLENIRKNNCGLNRCIQFRVEFSKIPNIVSRGLIGIEDFRYLDHFGVDIISIVRAIIKDIQAQALVQGGSTITQQLVKNLLFTNERQFIRKIKEAILAVYIEMKYEKTQILQEYFNEVFWGSLNGISIKGIQAASVMYFGKDIELLDEFEAAILVSMLKGPNYYHPIRKTQRLRDRAEFIFTKLEKEGIYKNKEKWTTKQWDNWVLRLKEIEELNIAEVAYLLSNEDERSGEEYLFYKLMLAAKNTLAKNEKINKDLSIKFIVSNGHRSDYYYSRFERNKINAMEKERQQLGSIIKPILYDLFLDFGIGLDQLVTTTPLELQLKSGKWSPRESHEVAIEEITLEKALQESLNNPILRVVEQIGYNEFEKKLEEVFPDIKTPLKEYPAQLLGAHEVTMSEIALQYQKLFYKECQREIPTILNALSDFSKTTVKRVVDKKLLSFRIFGKTGTTNNGFDNWYVGSDGRVSVVIWTGVEGERGAKDKLPLYGSNTSFIVFQEGVIYSGRRPGASLCME